MEDLKENRNLAFEGMVYSIKRIDILIVSLGGAGIYVCLETVKFLSENNLQVGNSLKLSGVILLFGIIINLISQVLGYLSHKNDFLMYIEEIDREIKIKLQKYENENEDIIKDYNRKSDKYSDFTDIFNYLSIFFISLGLMILLFFFFTTF